MPVVALDPVPTDAVGLCQRVELAPQLGVLDWLAVARFPAVFFPAVDPRLDAVLDVLRVGKKIDIALALQAFERANDRGQLHPVVGRGALAAEDFLAPRSRHQERAPTTRSGIAFARAVGVDRDRTALACAVLSHWWAPALAAVAAALLPEAECSCAILGAAPLIRARARSMHSRACRGAVARPFLRRSHAGVMTRMPSTFLVARR